MSNSEMGRSIFNQLISLFIFLFILVLFVPKFTKAGPYTLLQGDIIEVSVWGEDNLEKQLRVLPDGSITFPLVGRIEVVGKSSTEVEEKLSEKLSKFIPDAEVTVVISEIEGNSVFVLGKVAEPGKIVMVGPMTVLQALSVAGGLDKFADKGGVKVIRLLDGQQEALTVNYKYLIDGKDMSSNYELQAGDTVLVP